MNSLVIDFAGFSWMRVARRAGVAAWCVGITGVILCVAAGWQMQIESRRLAALEAEQHRLMSERAKRVAPMAVKSAVTDMQASAINGAVAQLNLPWPQLLDAVESATPPSIALLSLEPDGKKQMLSGTAEAKSLDAMLDYLAALKQQPFFHALVLSKHEVNERDANRPIRFQFQAHWKEGEQ
jgi:Tfp pilus assembly protein PilN